jgi:hypothetical protein
MARASEMAEQSRLAGHLVTLDGFVDERCAAEFLGLSPLTLRNRRHQHAPIPYRKLGGTRGRVQYSLLALAAYLLACERTESTDTNSTPNSDWQDDSSRPINTEERRK